NQGTWEMRAMEGDPKFEVSQYVPEFPYARYAELLGLKGVRVDRPEDIGSAWDEALGADRPAVLEAITDPDVPPLPPHISLEQAKAFTFAIARGDPDSVGIIKQSLKEIADEYLPHRGQQR
ncbi:MAG TPA: thiamine pyrophosphate-dependent enzyme, partial [Rubrobacter sp.]|nr:thiamine pyrophosphate-dependent enzyme [Rubrobacter sp.]